MTREDILVVEENTHLKHFIFEVVRCIDEGVPIANFFACSDKNSGGCDEPLLNAQKYIADALKKRLFYRGESECAYKIGDKISTRCNMSDIFVIADFVDVYVERNAFAKGVAIMRVGDESNTRIYPVSFINHNYILAESETL